MSGLVNVNYWAAFGPSRVTADAKMISAAPERTEVDASAIEDRADVILPGTTSIPGEISGRINGAYQRALVAEMAANTGSVPYVIHPPGSAEGSLSLFLLADLYNFEWMGERGGLWGFKTKVLGSSRLYNGYVMAGWPGQAPVAATGTTTGFEAVALAADQKLVWATCVVDPPGVTGTTPTLDVDLETDVDGTFTTPTVVASTAQFTDVGYQVIEIDGDTDPISDTFFRLSYTIGGTDSPSFQVISAIAIVPK